MNAGERTNSKNWSRQASIEDALVEWISGADKLMEGDSLSPSKVQNAARNRDVFETAKLCRDRGQMLLGQATQLLKASRVLDRHV